MEEEINWKLASNSQLKEECERLEKEFAEKQEILKETVNKIDELNTSLTQLSKQYIEITDIIKKREGKR